MLLFNSIVFGAFVGFLVDYWLGRGGVQDNAKLLAAVITGVIVAFLVYTGKLAGF